MVTLCLLLQLFSSGKVSYYGQSVAFVVAGKLYNSCGHKQYSVVFYLNTYLYNVI